jgi:hypothetical protein
VRAPVSDVDVGFADAAAWLQLELSEVSSFSVNAIRGNLNYGLRGADTSRQIPFAIDEVNRSGPTLGLYLNHKGVWDAWISDLTLDTTFSTSLDLDISLNATSSLGCGSLYLDPCSYYNDLINKTIYTGRSFPLAFDVVPPSQVFSMLVLPEPTSLALVGLALALMLSKFSSPHARRSRSVSLA